MQHSQDKCAMFVSFDAVAVSGITVEAMKIAKQLKERGFVSYLDLGYDIKIDKGNFNKPYDEENSIYRDVFTLVRIDDITSIPNYNLAFIEHAHNVLISRRIVITDDEKAVLLQTIEHTAQLLAERIVALWGKLGITNVVVENGTLPENIIYTKALYLAIEYYGQQHALDNFVIWRDHDLMWNSEKTVMKYGPAPYSHAIKPVKSKYITYVTLNDHLRKKLEAWCNYDVDVKVKKNTYDFSACKARSDIREQLNVRKDDILIARTTRIIPQKRLDRDIMLISHLNTLFHNNNSDRRVYLAVAGNESENHGYYQELDKLSKELKVQDYIKFIGALPHECMQSEGDAIAIEDLYHSCDLVSFLTSYDYDSYGNPIGEAVSNRRCYITTSYEYYHEVYGQHGFEAPVMMISELQDGLPNQEFVNNLFQFINDKEYMTHVAERNFNLGKKVLSNNVIDIFNLN